MSLAYRYRFSQVWKASFYSSLSAWEYIRYMPDNLNMSDRIVVLSEQIAEMLVVMLSEKDLINDQNTYLEKYVDEILRGNADTRGT